MINDTSIKHVPERPCQHFSSCVTKNSLFFLYLLHLSPAVLEHFAHRLNGRPRHLRPQIFDLKFGNQSIIKSIRYSFVFSVWITSTNKVRTIMWTSGAITVSLCEVMSSSKRRMPSILTSLVTGQKCSKFGKFFRLFGCNLPFGWIHVLDGVLQRRFRVFRLLQFGGRLRRRCQGGGPPAGRHDAYPFDAIRNRFVATIDERKRSQLLFQVGTKGWQRIYTWCCRGVESAETSAGGRSHLVTDSKRRTKRPIDFWRADGNLPNPRRRPPRRRTNFLLLLPRKRKAVSPEPDCGRHADSCPHLAAGRPDAAGRHLVNNPAQLPATAPV